MSEIVKAGTPALASPIGAGTPRVEGAVAGEALGAFDACYIRSTDGKVYRSQAGASPSAAYAGALPLVPPGTIHGYVTAAAAPGERVQLLSVVEVEYGAGLTPTTPYYLSATVPGGLTDVPPTPAAPIIARAVSATRIACGARAGVSV